MTSEQVVVAKILDTYGVTYSRIQSPQKGYRNSSFAIDDRLNVILYKTEPGILARITNANAVGAWVATAGLPARMLYDQRIIKLTAADRIKYAAIYYYLPGNTIPWEAYTMAHIKTLGTTMARMHKALATFDARTLPDVAAECIALNKRMQHYFSDANVRQALQRKLGLTMRTPDFMPLLQATQTLPDQQALHMDFVRGNILFNDTTITGILDFEKTARGHTVYDVARTLAFLLVDCKYKPEEKIRKYFLYSGYGKRGEGSLVRYTHRGKDIQESLVTFFLLHDFYKFLRHNPYESLPQNEHFVRTKAMLLKRRLIEPR